MAYLIKSNSHLINKEECNLESFFFTIRNSPRFILCHILVRVTTHATIFKQVKRVCV